MEAKEGRREKTVHSALPLKASTQKLVITSHMSLARASHMASPNSKESESCAWDNWKYLVDYINDYCRKFCLSPAIFNFHSTLFLGCIHVDASSS